MRHDERHVGVCVEELEYLERWTPPVPPLPAFHVGLRDATQPAQGMRRLVVVRGVTRRPAENLPATAAPGDDPPTVALLTGACRLRTPMVFVLGDRGYGLDVGIGVWSPRSIKPDELDARCDAVVGALEALYPEVAIEDGDPRLSDHEVWSSALGVPFAEAPVAGDDANVIDRLVRAMAGRRWTAILVAQPANRVVIKEKRAQILEETRRAEADTQGRSNPLVENYVDLLTVQLKALNEAAVSGGWRVATYLGAAEVDMPRLSTVWMSLFSGAGALPDPVRVLDRDPHVKAWAQAWAMPDAEGPAGGPSRYRHPSRFQSLLTSRQLAQCVQLPQVETDGFSVTTAARFDVVRRFPQPPSITLGAIGARPGGPPYDIAVADLTRHVFVAGVTGSGKTTTVRRILSEADVPFLVLEPVKTEYRSLLADPLFAGRVRIFTIGNEAVAPLHLNPLQVLAGTTIGTHIDLLKSLFVASFGMWSPLPQILERALYDVYSAAGWDILHDVNPRVPAGERPAGAFPTLSVLHARVEQVIDSLGYSGDVVSNMRAALSTRIRALCLGGKGRMLDTTDALDAGQLFEHPAVLELEALGDDDDKAFVMGLVLMQLAAHRRAHPGRGLRHLFVIEEAHRLLANVPTTDTTVSGNPRGKAVETFVHLLAEVRSLGQGIIVSDQSPTRLAPEVVKNTNLKIAHRIVATEDRAVLGSAMAMTVAQERDLATLTQGVAAVFSEGDDAPIQVRIPPGPTDPGAVVTAAHVRAATIGRSAATVRPGQRPPGGLSEQEARTLIDDPAVVAALTQAVLSAMDDETAAARLWDGISRIIRARRSPLTPHDDVAAAVLEFFARDVSTRWAAEYGWSVVQAQQFAAAVIGLFSPDGAHLHRARAHALLARSADSFPRCREVCGPAPGACLYRGAAASAHTAGRLAAAWSEATRDGAATGDLSRRIAVAAHAANELVEPITSGSSPRHDRAGACFLQIGLLRHGDLPLAAVDYAVHSFSPSPEVTRE
jgi:Helicase HerA, central domain